MQQFQRSDRLAEQIRRDVSDLLEPEMRDHLRGLVTFTAVRITRDLQFATVLYSFLGNPDDRDAADAWLFQQRGHVRKAIARRLRMRHVPEISFTFDPSIEEGLRIEQLLNEVRQERKPDSDTP